MENIFRHGHQNIPFVVPVVSLMEEHVVNERVGKKVPKGHLDQILAFVELGGVGDIGVHLDASDHRLRTVAVGAGGQHGDLHCSDRRFLEDNVVVAGIVVGGIVVGGIVGGGGVRAAAARSSVGAWLVVVVAAGIVGIVGTVVVDNGIDSFVAGMVVVVGSGTFVAGLRGLMLELHEPPGGRSDLC